VPDERPGHRSSSERRPEPARSHKYSVVLVGASLFAMASSKTQKNPLPFH
jgi:hypothetical protein